MELQRIRHNLATGKQQIQKTFQKVHKGTGNSI